MVKIDWEYNPGNDDFSGDRSQFGETDIFGRLIRSPQYAVDVNPHGFESANGVRSLHKNVTQDGIHVVYKGVNGKEYDLAGPFEGQQGVILAKNFVDTLSIPFEQKFSRGTYMVGSQYERTDYLQREISLGIEIHPGASWAKNFYGVDPSSYNVLSAHRDWLNAWSPTEDGWLCFFTKMTGWRNIPVRLAEPIQGNTEQSPLVTGKLRYDMNIVASRPYFTGNTINLTWVNDSNPTTLDDEGFYHHDFYFTYRGDFFTYPKYLVEGTNIFKCSDNVDPNRIHEFPFATKKDGAYIVDTDPTHKLITTQYEPTDNIIMAGMRNVELIRLIAGDLVNSTLPMWRRAKNIFFTDPIPAARDMIRGNRVGLRVFHNQPNARVTVIVPVCYQTAW